MKPSSLLTLLVLTGFALIGSDAADARGFGSGLGSIGQSFARRLVGSTSTYEAKPQAWPEPIIPPHAVVTSSGPMATEAMDEARARAVMPVMVRPAQAWRDSMSAEPRIGNEVLTERPPAKVQAKSEPHVDDPRFYSLSDMAAARQHACQYKPVMSDRDYIVCGIEPPRSPMVRALY